MQPLVRVALAIYASVFVTGVARSDEGNIRLEVDPYFCKWESTRDTLLCTNDSMSPETAATITYDASGAEKLRVYPLRDFPGARSLSVWSATSSTDGGVAITGVLMYGDKEGRHVTLVYGNQGQLLQVWDMKPYHQHLIASDSSGNIYGFGDRLDLKAGADSPDFPLLIKYSPKGEVLKDLLPQRTFDHDITDENPKSGRNRLLVVQDEAVLFLAASREILRFDADGKQARRLDLHSAVDKIVESQRGDAAEIVNIAVAHDRSYMVQLRVYQRANPRTMSVILARIAGDGSSFVLRSSTPLNQSRGTFEGYATDGRLVFLQGRKNGILALDRDIP